VRRDLAKCTTERPRHGRSWAITKKYGGSVRVNPDREYDYPEEYGGFRSSARNRQINAKGFSDFLSPLRGAIRKNIGRPWDKVFGEFCEALDRRGLSGYHIWTHLMSLCNRIRKAWGKTNLDRFKPLDFQNWLKGLKDKPKTKGHLKAFVNRLFYKAKLYGMLDFQENPIGLVEVRGISKRSKKPVVLTIDQFFLLLGLLPEPYRTMTLAAQCTGLRIEEILVLNWAKVDFERLCMKIEEAVVHGRIGPVKSEYSQDELPLDPSFATVMLDWKRRGTSIGLVFPSHVTGQCYHASPIQQDWIRRAGWCLVSCPACGAEPGVRCSGFPVGRSKRPLIAVHDARQAAATAAGLGGIGWHTFRHTYRALLSEADIPLEVQQKLMRHADIRTTTQYGEVSMGNKRAANSRVVRGILIRKSVQ